jgi:hypothetical protein
MAGRKSFSVLKILAAAAALGVVIQLVPMNRTNPPVQGDLEAPAPVKAILKASCYDCHSNETVWPWYSKVAPMSWLVARDVSAGRRHLNFSSWNGYNVERRRAVVRHAIREVQHGEMPPWFYVIKHPDGKMTPDKQAVLEAWAAAN